MKEGEGADDKEYLAMSEYKRLVMATLFVPQTPEEAEKLEVSKNARIAAAYL